MGDQANSPSLSASGVNAVPQGHVMTNVNGGSSNDVLSVLKRGESVRRSVTRKDSTVKKQYQEIYTGNPFRWVIEKEKVAG